MSSAICGKANLANNISNWNKNKIKYIRGQRSRFLILWSYNFLMTTFVLLHHTIRTLYLEYIVLWLKRLLSISTKITFENLKAWKETLQSKVGLITENSSVILFPVYIDQQCNEIQFFCIYNDFCRRYFFNNLFVAYPHFVHKLLKELLEKNIINQD